MVAGIWRFENIGQPFTIQQDIDYKHTVKVCRDLLEARTAAGEALLVVSLSQSPNLSPIELMWESESMTSTECSIALGILVRSLATYWPQLHGKTNKQNAQVVMRAKEGHIKWITIFRCIFNNITSYLCLL